MLPFKFSNFDFLSQPLPVEDLLFFCRKFFKKEDYDARYYPESRDESAYIYIDFPRMVGRENCLRVRYFKVPTVPSSHTAFQVSSRSPITR